jgi:hypothetical protein
MNRRLLLIVGFIVAVFAVSFAIQWRASHEALQVADSPPVPTPLAARTVSAPGPTSLSAPTSQSLPRDVGSSASVRGAESAEPVPAPIPDKSTLPEVPVDVQARRIPPRSLGRHEVAITSKLPDGPLEMTAVLLSQANGSKVEMPITLPAGGTLSIGVGDTLEIGDGDTVTLKSPGYRDSVTVVR